MPEAEQSSDDWGADIASDWAEITSRDGQDEAPAKATPEPESTEEQPAQTSQERARDEQGRFAKAERDRAALEAPASPDKPAVVATEQTAPEIPVAIPGVDLNRPPSGWKPAAKAQWSTLTPEVRAEFYRREKDFENGQRELIPDAQLGKSLRQVIEPYRLLIESEGATPESTVHSLLQTAAILRMGTAEQKTHALNAIARRYGVTMQNAEAGEYQPAPVQQQPQDFRDPRVDQWLAHQQQQQQAEINGAITKWTAETDAKGEPLRPYVDNVFPEMLAMIPQLQQASPGMPHHEVLQAAYDRAAWANPEVRAVLMQQAEAKRREESLRVAADAKKAASPNMPRRGLVSTPATGSIEDTIRELLPEYGFG